MDIHSSAFLILIIAITITVMGFFLTGIDKGFAAFFMGAATTALAVCSGSLTTTYQWNAVSNVCVLIVIAVMALVALTWAFKAGQESAKHQYFP